MNERSTVVIVVSCIALRVCSNDILYICMRMLMVESYWMYVSGITCMVPLQWDVAIRIHT